MQKLTKKLVESCHHGYEKQAKDITEEIQQQYNGRGISGRGEVWAGRADNEIGKRDAKEA